jgi:hypothetical protein
LGLSNRAAFLLRPLTLQGVAASYREAGWPVKVEGDAFTAPYSAPSAGPPPWDLYGFTASRTGAWWD